MYGSPSTFSGGRGRLCKKAANKSCSAILNTKLAWFQMSRVESSSGNGNVSSVPKKSQWMAINSLGENSSGFGRWQDGLSLGSGSLQMMVKTLKYVSSLTTWSRGML